MLSILVICGIVSEKVDLSLLLVLVGRREYHTLLLLTIGAD